MQPTSGAGDRAEPCPEIDMREFQSWLSRATPEQKNAALYWLLRNQLGPRIEREYGVYDPDEFLYAVVISPGQREAFRYLEDPGLLEELRRASREPGVPLRDVLKELGVDV